MSQTHIARLLKLVSEIFTFLFQLKCSVFFPQTPVQWFKDIQSALTNPAVVAVSRSSQPMQDIWTGSPALFGLNSVSRALSQ